MKALVYHGKGDMRCDTVPDPRSSIRAMRSSRLPPARSAAPTCISSTASFQGWRRAISLAMRQWAKWWKSGRENKALKVGDRVVVPFTIACGECFFCKRGFFSGCERTNPDHKKAEKLWGHSPAGLFGYSHLLGGYPGGQAEYLRVPYADVGPLKVPDGLTDEQVLFLSDIFPTGYMAADFCNIQPGDTIAIWGCGPSGKWPSGAPFCWEPSGCWRSIRCPSGWRLPVKPVPRRWISGRSISTTAFRNSPKAAAPMPVSTPSAPNLTARRASIP